MRVAIDARWIFPQITGIGEYTRQLVRILPGLDPAIHYHVLFEHESLLARTAEETGLSAMPNVTVHRLPYGLFSLRNQAMLGRFLKATGVDLYHSTNYMIPLPPFPRHRPGKIRCVTTIHDVIPLLFPHHAPRSKKARLFPIYKRLMIEVAARSDLVLTDSRASRADILGQLRIKGDATSKVQVVYCGVTPPPDGPPGPAQPAAQGANSDPVLLYVGRCDPYKNIETLIRALAVVRNQENIPARLVIAGPRDDRYPEPHRVSAMLGVDDAVEWKGYVPDRELANLYRTASVLVHASRYEGFGLQVLEAMANGLPVICSNVASLPEVAGDAALQLAPDDIAGFAAAVCRVLQEADTAEAMRQKGLKRVDRFSWQATAEGVLAAYLELG